jgi:hypothetical protein
VTWTWTINPPLLSSMPSSLIPRKSVPAPFTWMVLEVPMKKSLPGTMPAGVRFLVPSIAWKPGASTLDLGTKAPIRAVLEAQELECHRYVGTDPAILNRVLSTYCDYPMQSPSVLERTAPPPRHILRSSMIDPLCLPEVGGRSQGVMPDPKVRRLFVSWRNQGDYAHNRRSVRSHFKLPHYRIGSRYPAPRAHAVECSVSGFIADCDLSGNTPPAFYALCAESRRLAR